MLTSLSSVVKFQTSRTRPSQTTPLPTRYDPDRRLEWSGVEVNSGDALCHRSQKLVQRTNEPLDEISRIQASIDLIRTGSTTAMRIIRQGVAPQDIANLAVSYITASVPLILAISLIPRLTTVSAAFTTQTKPHRIWTANQFLSNNPSERAYETPTTIVSTQIDITVAAAAADLIL